MESRQSINARVIRWIEERARCADSVSLALLYGSVGNGTANELSDVDCYYIPVENENSRSDGMAADFILAGVGYDLYPMSWERVEAIAALEGGLLPCVGDCTVLYARSEEDRRRFEAIQETLRRNLADPEASHRAAERKFALACRMLAEMRASREQFPQPISALRAKAGLFLLTAADAAALSCGDYFHFGAKKQYEDLCTRFPELLPEIPAEYAAVVFASTAEEILDHAEALLRAVGARLGLTVSLPEIPEPEPEAIHPDFPALAALYEEISSTFNKIYRCCGVSVCGSEQDPVLAFLSAAVLQDDLEYGVSIGAPAESAELLCAFDPANLPAFAAHVKRAEEALIRAIGEGGAVLRRYGTWEEFAAAEL